MPLSVEEYAWRVAGGLKSSASCTCLIGDDMDPREVFNAIKAHVPVVGIISTTGRTLSLGVVTEDATHFGHNDRINLRTHLAQVRRVLGLHPDRVWI